MRAGTAATLLENQRLRKYPGIKCQPFVVEALGRMGEQATRILRGLARNLDAEVRGPAMSKWCQALSVALQRHNAAMVRSATTGT